MSSDNWETPQWLFDELNEEFNFDIDLCATKENSKCNQYYIDYLKNIKKDFTWWAVEYRPLKHKYNCAFMNPPYSNPKPFIEKAWEDSKYCKIVCLVPNTIKTAKYLDLLDEHNGEGTFRQWKKGLEIKDLSRRTKFNHPTKIASSPSFGGMLLIMDRRNV